MSPSFLARIPLILALLAVPGASLVAQGTLERVADRGEIRIGYRTDARPLSYVENGQPAGYSVDFCRRIAAAVRDTPESAFRGRRTADIAHADKEDFV